MAELFPILIALACPLGMAAMMGLPALKRAVGRRANTATGGGD
jgi:hypothetical protein